MKKFFKIFGLVILAAIVLGTFYMLWNKSRPKIVEYEIMTVNKSSVENISVATDRKSVV